jgi:hypothetical protein
MGAEMALRETGAINLIEALDYLPLLAELRPAKAPRGPALAQAPETEAPMAPRVGARARGADRALPGRPAGARAARLLIRRMRPTVASHP